MPTTQRQKLLELLTIQQQDGTIRSTMELEAELQRLLEANGKAGGPTFKARQQSGVFDSSAHNANIKELAFDLATLFQASSTVDRLLSDNQQLGRSLLEGLKKNLRSLQATVRKYQFLQAHTDGLVDSVQESFHQPSYTETDETKLRRLRTDRMDNYLEPFYQAEIIGESLQLAGIETMDQLKTNYGRKLARIDVLHQTGSATTHPSHGIEQAIDGSNQTYWATNILVDQPIIQSMDDLWLHDYTNVPKDGAICEVQIALSGLTTVSDIHLDPFGPYPLEVVAIHGYETEDMGGVHYELISPNHSSIHQRSQKSVYPMTFQFPSVDIAKIRILLRQENYVKEHFLLDPSQKRNTELWNQLSEEQGIIPDEKETNETMAMFNQTIEETGWSVYLDQVKKWGASIQESSMVKAASKALATIRTGGYQNPLLLTMQAMDSTKDDSAIQEEPKINAQKFSYLYGAYDISVFGRKYQSQSIYVSTPLPVMSSAKSISLHTTERHHEVSVGNEVLDPITGQWMDPHTARITDIEYYVSHVANPSPLDWHPILPLDKRYVTGELLSANLYESVPSDFLVYEQQNNPLIVYSFRFPVLSATSVTLRRNGLPMNPSTYRVTDDGKQIGIFSKYYSAASIYTVDYQPVDRAWKIPLDESTGILPIAYLDDNGQSGEYFADATVNRQVMLKHVPYLFKGDLFSYSEDKRAYEQQATEDLLAYPMHVTVNGETFKNITDYGTQTYDEKRLEENDGKTFGHVGNRLVFGKPIDQTPLTNIYVDYFYVSTEVRLKAILRRNSVDDESVTPALYDYQLRFDTYDSI